MHLSVFCPTRTELEVDPIKVVEDKKFQGQGNIPIVWVGGDNITEVFIGFGERGVSAETVEKRIVKSIQDYLAINVPVGRYLADQHMLDTGRRSRLYRGSSPA